MWEDMGISTNLISDGSEAVCESDTEKDHAALQSMIKSEAKHPVCHNNLCVCVHLRVSLAWGRVRACALMMRFLLDAGHNTTQQQNQQKISV
jgi:hypothetical protein